MLGSGLFIYFFMQAITWWLEFEINLKVEKTKDVEFYFPEDVIAE